MRYPEGYDYDSLLKAIKAHFKYIKSHDTYYLNGSEKNTQYEVMPEDGYFHIDFQTDKKNRGKLVRVAICGSMNSNKDKTEIYVFDEELLSNLCQIIQEMSEANP